MQKSKNTNRFWMLFKVISGAISIAWLVVWALLSDRLTGWGNNMIDEWLANHPGLGWKTLSWLLENPFNLVSAIAICILVIIFIDWYRHTKKQVKEREVNEVKEISPPANTAEPHLAILERFSSHLDEITNGENINSRGMIFLRKIKTAPPFIGIEHSIIAPDIEQKLIEYFLAQDFKRTNEKFIRGGGHYQMKETDESWESVSDKIYGSAKFANQLQAGNHSRFHPPPKGSYISVPYIDISESLGVSSEYIARKYSIVEYRWIEPTLNSLKEQFNLIDDDPLPLMKMIYDAAEKTLNNERIKQKQYLAPEVEMEVRKLVSPTIPPHKRVGVIIKNLEIKELTDIQIKLVKATQFEFSDETGYLEDSNWIIAEDNCYFNTGANNKVGADNEEPFYFADIQDKQVVFLLNKKIRPIKYRYPHIQSGFKTHNVKCEIEFEVYGKISGDYFRKQRFQATIDSFRIIPIYDDSVDDTVSIDIKKEVTPVEQQETDKGKDKPA